MTKSHCVWQSPRGKRAVTHWASLLRWIWSISEYNLMTRDSRKRTPIGGPFIRERRESGPEKQQPNHNPCWPEGRNQRKPIVLTIDLLEFTKNAYICLSRRTENYVTMPVICPPWPCDPGHFRERGKNLAPAYGMSDKGSYDRLKPKWCFNSTHDFC